MLKGEVEDGAVAGELTGDLLGILEFDLYDPYPQYVLKDTFQTTGDLVVFSGGVPVRLGAGNDGTFLAGVSGPGVPAYRAIANSDIPTVFLLDGTRKIAGDTIIEKATPKLTLKTTSASPTSIVLDTSGANDVPTTPIGSWTTIGTYQPTDALPAIVSGGTGYSVGNFLDVNGGTLAGMNIKAFMQVTAVSAGVITAVKWEVQGRYASPPTNPASTTAQSGPGTGATFTITWSNEKYVMEYNTLFDSDWFTLRCRDRVIMLTESNDVGLYATEFVGDFSFVNPLTSLSVIGLVLDEKEGTFGSLQMVPGATIQLKNPAGSAWLTPPLTFNSDLDTGIYWRAANQMGFAVAAAQIAYFNVNGLVFEEGKDIITGTTTGTKFGRGTGQKIGFWNAAPIVRPSAYTQTFATANKTHAARTAAALTDNVAGTVGTTLAAIPDPADTPASADALRDDLVSNVLPKIRDALSSIADQTNKERTDALDTAELVNSWIDDAQLMGLAS